MTSWSCWASGSTRRPSALTSSSAPAHSEGLAGVGIDLAERATFAQLPEAWVQRAATRWLTPGERRWCARQPSFREAVVVVLSCKEAAYKACNGAGGPWDVALLLEGASSSGGSAVAVYEGLRIEVDWGVSSGLVLALARAAVQSP